MEIYTLQDNRVLGVSVTEITAFPDVQGSDDISDISRAFQQFISELHKLSGDGDTVAELLWVTEKVSNQTFRSRIRIFYILRRIGANRSTVEAALEQLQFNMVSVLNAKSYTFAKSEATTAELAGLLGAVSRECACAVVKADRFIGNMGSLYPYYHCDVIYEDNRNNFGALVAALCQCEGCCFSFQLIPTRFTPTERSLINELAAELGNIASGIVTQQFYQDAAALPPAKVYAYYNERSSSPVFLYNILVFGRQQDCTNLAAKLVSLLQSGEQRITTADFVCMNLTQEKIDLKVSFPHYCWNINSRLVYAYRNMQTLQKMPVAMQLFRLPYLLSAEEAVSFFRLPKREKFMTALKSNQVAQVQEQFSTDVTREDNIKLGQLVSTDSSPVIIGCSTRDFTRHALIVGTPGTGKTTFSINLLLQFFQRGIPFLAIEPTKTEYRALLDAVPQLQIFTPGNNSVSPFVINPFIPPKGICIEQYIPSLTSAFKAAFSMPSPLDVIFLKAVRSTYTQYGWKDYSCYGDADVTPFGLHEFIVVFKKLVSATNYSSEVRGNIESAGILRLTNLLEQNSNIYDSIHTVPIDDLLTGPTVLELNAIDNAEQKSLLMALLLINICLYTKHNQEGNGELKNVILIDEAHVLLGDNGSATAEGSANAQGTTVKALQDMIAEIRSFGTSIIIADQSPTKVSREVVANTDLKVSFRLVQSLEKNLIADSTNMDEPTQQNLSRLQTGEAYVYYNKLESPQMVRTADARANANIRLSVSNSEVKARSTYWAGKETVLCPFAECAHCLQCAAGCDFLLRAQADYIANRALDKYRKSLVDVAAMKKCLYHLPNLLEHDFSAFSGEQWKRAVACTRIRLWRKCRLELSVGIEPVELVGILKQFPPKASGKEND